MRRFLRPGTFLLGCILPLCLRGQAPLPSGSLTPETLLRFCAAQNALSCAVSLHGQYTLTLPGEWRLPHAMHLRFTADSALHIPDGVLDFDGERVDAPANAPIFPDGERVRGLADARPEWFAEASAPPAHQPLAAAALAAAYQATVPWGTLYLQPRAYLSPFSGCTNVQPGLRYLSPRTFVGSGRPTPDDPGQPTHLRGGTTLLGGFMGTAPLRIAHLGIDVGPQVNAQQLAGCAPPAAFIEQPQHRFVSGDRVEDVSVLTTGALNMHSVMIAGHQDVAVLELWIWTLGGTHGLVLKSSNSVVDGLHCSGASSDCLIVKSDYTTDMLGRASENRVAHVDIHPLQPGGEVGGIVVDAKWDTVNALMMEDIRETGTRLGIVLLGSTLFRPHDISIENWTADAVAGQCLFADRADAVQVSNFHCALLPSAQAGVSLYRTREVVLREGRLSCDGAKARCASAQTDAVFDDGDGTRLEGIQARDLGGYLLHGLGPGVRSGSAQAIDMGNRLFLPYRETAGMRVRRAVADLKPTLRIVYTSALTRIVYRPRFYAMLASVLAIMVGWELSLRSRRRRRPALRF